MVDETNAQDAASKTPVPGVFPNAAPANASQARPAFVPSAPVHMHETPPSDPEPVILEEIIIKKAPEVRTATTASAHSPQTTGSSVSQPPKAIQEPTQPRISPTTLAAPAAMPGPSVSDPSFVQVDAQEKVPDVGLPTHVSLPIAPTIDPSMKERTMSDPVVRDTGKLGTDIAQILKEVKLPERRSESARQIENKAAVFDTLSGTHPTEATPTTPDVTPATTEQSAVVPLRTLKDDLQHVVKDQRMSVVRAVSLEEDKRAHDRREEPPTFATTERGHRTLFLIMGALGLIMLGAIALYAVYSVAQNRTAQSARPQTTSLLFAENSIPFSIDGQSSDSIKQSLAAARTSLQGTLGSITQLLPTTGATTTAGGVSNARAATFSEFMHAIGAHPPDELVRALSDTFFFGIHAADKNAPVLVIPVLSYEHAFAGMLAWESNMNAELAPVFTAVPATTVDQNGLPTYRTFQDLTMRNYDVRALKDDQGNVQLYYSFPSQQLLIIAESPYSFAEVLSRLQAAREL